MTYHAVSRALVGRICGSVVAIDARLQNRMGERPISEPGVAHGAVSALRVLIWHLDGVAGEAAGGGHVVTVAAANDRMIGHVGDPGTRSRNQITLNAELASSRSVRIIDPRIGQRGGTHVVTGARMTLATLSALRMVRVREDAAILGLD